MRLINLENLQLEQLNDHETPNYAILSHTWEHEEVGYKDWSTQTDDSHLQGYKKILGFRDVARSTYGCKYGWVDTCCIDKSSSAELSEAINSMFKYYKNAAVCISYLADVNQHGAETDENESGKRVCSSRWLSRGWTLQELIAPSAVVFYDCQWRRLAHMSKILAERLEVFTSIPSSVLLKTSLPAEWSIAQRMSWASQRQTTRVEDQAYCLLGLFDVSLPLIYGEGDRAFTRLQEEIIRSSTDHSIFAWNFSDTLSRQSTGSSLRSSTLSQGSAHQPSASSTTASITRLSSPGRRLLAPSPAYFHGCNGVVECYLDVKGWVESYEMTNLGLSISLPLVPCSSQLGLYHAILNCRFQDKQRGPVAINLKRASQGFSRSQHANNFDLETMTFGVVRTSEMEPSKFQCSAEHQDRLSIVEEEDLINHQKSRLTVLRTTSPSIDSQFQKEGKKLRMASIRASKSFQQFKPNRLKLVITKDLESHAQRKLALPEYQWDSNSHIWFANGPVSIFCFGWDAVPSRITFVLATGDVREVPFHLAVLETSTSTPMDHSRLLSYDYELVTTNSVRRGLQTNNDTLIHASDQPSWNSERIGMDGLRLGQAMIYDLHFATMQLRIERFEKMGKSFYTLRIAFTSESNTTPKALQPSAELSQPSTFWRLMKGAADDDNVEAIQHFGVNEMPSQHDWRAIAMDGNVPASIPEDIVEPRPQVLSTAEKYPAAKPLRRRFSFEAN